MGFNISTFRSRVSRGGARPNLFKINLYLPTDAGGVETNANVQGNIEVLCNATSLPGKVIGNIDIPYFGRTIKSQGITSFNTWTTTVINTDGKIRDKILSWMQGIAGTFDGTRGDIDYIPLSQGPSADVHQISKTGDVLETYQFTNLYPQSIGDISLDWGNEAIQTFTCTWRFDFWGHKSVGTTTATDVVTPTIDRQA